MSDATPKPPHVCRQHGLAACIAAIVSTTTPTIALSGAVLSFEPSRQRNADTGKHPRRGWRSIQCDAGRQGQLHLLQRHRLYVRQQREQLRGRYQRALRLRKRGRYLCAWRFKTFHEHDQRERGWWSLFRPGGRRWCTPELASYRQCARGLTWLSVSDLTWSRRLSAFRSTTISARISAQTREAVRGTTTNQYTSGTGSPKPSAKRRSVIGCIS
jgi:hypothetical protein